MDWIMVPRGHTPKENRLSSHQPSIAPQQGLGVCLSLPVHARAMTGWILYRSWATVAMYSWVWWSCHNRKCCFTLALPLTILSPLLWYLLWEGSVMPMSYLGWSTLQIFSPHFNQFWISELFTAHYSRKVLWWGLRATPICGYRDTSWESSLVFWA